MLIQTQHTTLASARQQCESSVAAFPAYACPVAPRIPSTSSPKAVRIQVLDLTQSKITGRACRRSQQDPRRRPPLSAKPAIPCISGGASTHHSPTERGEHSPRSAQPCILRCESDRGQAGSGQRAVWIADPRLKSVAIQGTAAQHPLQHTQLRSLPHRDCKARGAIGPRHMKLLTRRPAAVRSASPARGLSSSSAAAETAVAICGPRAERGSHSCWVPSGGWARLRGGA
jgi:hypothetical protein